MATGFTNTGGSDPSSQRKTKEDPPPLFSNPRRGEEVRALLDMLSLAKYSSHFAESGRLDTVTDLIDHPNLWKQIIKGVRERETLEGYLSLRASKPAKEVEASEMRLKTFTVVRTTLKQLRDLQLRKAEMERTFVIQKGVAKKTIRSGKDDEEVRKRLDDLLDEMDDCKERLESAQRELQSNSADTRAPRKILKPSTLKPKRPMSAPQKKQQSTSDGGFSPRLAGEPEIPSMSNPYCYGGGGASSMGSSSARPPGGDGKPQQKAFTQTTTGAYAPGASNEPHVKGMPPNVYHTFSSRTSTRQKTGKFLFEPDFESAASQSSAAKDHEPTMTRAPKATEHARHDLGDGWNRQVPVSRMDLLNRNRVNNMSEKHRRKMQTADELRHQEALRAEVVRKQGPSLRKAQVFVSASGSNGVQVNSMRQASVGPGAVPVAPGASTASQRRAASAAATVKPIVTGVTPRKAPTRFALMGGDKDLSLNGLKATRFSLGLSGTGVCVDHNDYVQMKCGAVRYGSGNRKL